MALFGKFLSQRFAKSDHPLGSDGNVARLLADIPTGAPLRTLQDIGHWLDDIQRFEPEIGLPALLRATLRLDAAAELARAALLASYLDPADREHASELLWNEIDRSQQQAYAAYRHCLSRQQQEPHADIDQKAINLAATRAMRGLAVRKKLARFRYRTPDADWWREASSLLSLAGVLRAAQEPVACYDDQADKRSVLQQFLAGVYFELAPLANFVPQQVEMLDRLLVNQAEQLELTTSLHAASTHWLLLGGGSGPLPLNPPPPADPLVRFLARGRLRPAITRLAAEARKTGALPPWFLPAGGDPDLGLRLLLVLMMHWSANPPQRGTARQPTHDPLRAVLGFDLARRMIAFSDFARSGRSLNYDGSNLDALFEDNRFGRTTPATEVEPDTAPQPAAIDPVAILAKLELAGDRQMMEEWVQTDLSDTGLGAVVPAVRARHRIGGLVCLRYGDGIEWHLGIIRRIGRNAEGQATLGIETLPRPSTSAHVKPRGQKTTAWAATDDAGHGYRDAILVAHGGNQLILPRGTFAADLEVDIRTSEGRIHARLVNLSEAGDDYEHVRFVPLE